MSTSWKEGPELCDGVLVRKDVRSKCGWREGKQRRRQQKEDDVSKAGYGQISNYIAITRHPVGSDTCEAVKVWNWAEAGKHCGTM